MDAGLPITGLVPEIRRVLKDFKSAVIQAPPGAGKTTIVPLCLMDEDWLAGRKIVMLEPRRLAARAAASRMSELIGQAVGSTVGYRTRLDTKVARQTRVEVVTEGILTRMLQSDPSIEDIGCLIFDEFHERSLNADLGLALSIDARAHLCDDLRIVVMSATMDGTLVSRLLDNAPVIRSEGRSYPVSVRYEAGAGADPRLKASTGPSFISCVIKAVTRALSSEVGSILVFLPGSGEIHRVEAGLRMAGLGPDVDITPLYGELPRQMQDSAIRPSPEGRRKVVLSTNIAETSLTIEGVTVVIDSGLQRVQRFSPSIGMSGIETVRVSRASADQRSGRAGRTCPGISIRLWAEADNMLLKEKGTPEIMEADLTHLALELAEWGVKDEEDLKWLDAPPSGALSHARDTLLRISAIDSEGRITPHGKTLASLPLQPRLSHMVIKADSLGQGHLASVIASLLGERDVLAGARGTRASAGARLDEYGPDIRPRLEALHALVGKGGGRDHLIDRAVCERVITSAGQIRRILGIGDTDWDIEMAGVILAFAYPDRVGRRREDGSVRYLLSSGRGAYLSGRDHLSSSEFMVAASLDAGERESRVLLCAPVERADLEAYLADEITESEMVSWDDQALSVSARRQKRLGELVITDAPVHEPNRSLVNEAFIEGVCKAVRQKGLQILPWDKASENLRGRINLLKKSGMDEATGLAGLSPVFSSGLSDEWLMENLKTWLKPWCEGMTRLEHLKRLDMKAVIMGLLSWSSREALDRLVPTHITVPSGSKIAIDYSSGERPVLSVKLQEMFGCAVTPTVAQGKVALLIQLLSPAGRVLQVTSDLAGFWASSYHLVRKEMKGRYPKHHWPEDPMEAMPHRGTGKKRGDG